VGLASDMEYCMDRVLEYPDTAGTEVVLATAVELALRTVLGTVRALASGME
jgi:hypothetical protein